MLATSISIGFLALATASNAEQKPLDFEAQSHTQKYRFEPLLHLPGISPYFDAIGFGLEHTAPLGCKVTAASYLVRHAALYANDNDYETYIEPFLARWDASKGKGWSGPLSFLRKWKNPIDDPENQMEQITPSGAHAATQVGKHLLKHYPHLISTVKRINHDKKSRTKDTARAFAKAFPQDVELVQISSEGEFHSTIPHKYCPAFTKAAGDDELETFINHYTAPILSRLNPHAPFDLVAHDVVGLQQLCGYESAITDKSSKICSVFTDSEWMAYEYAWDLKYQYMVGHGNPLSPYLGFPWLNVTASMFSKFHDPNHAVVAKDMEDDADDGQRFFLSFTHREVPPFLATALGLFNSSSSTAEDMPTHSINFGRSWKMATLIPFLGHVGIEKMTCDVSSGAKEGAEFVRIIANTAPRPIPKCQDGPGASCEFHEFRDLVANGMETYGDFHGVCGDHDKKGKPVWV